MKIKNNIATSASGAVFNPSTGDSFSTNPMGSEIIALLKESKTQKQIIEHVCSRYDVDAITFEKDFDDYVSQLADNNLIEI
jgi:uncharacterized lipoprotein YddW (UPF0748 family)